MSGALFSVFATAYPMGPVTTYHLTIAGNVTSVDEGVALEFDIATTNVADGTTLYWSVGDNFNGGPDNRYSPGTSGEVTINSNAGSFTITVSADNTTAISNPQLYSVHLYSGNPGYFGGTQVAYIDNITVNDTSQTPHPTSLVFDGNTGTYARVDGTPTDWDFSVTDNFTIEFWSKATSSSASTIFTVMSQGPQTGIDITYDSGHLSVFDGHDGYITWPEPTPGVWTHVAVINAGGTVYAFYNGVRQTVLSGAWVPGYHWGNGTDVLYIGQRGPNVSGQNFNGKLTDIRICSNVQYIDVLNIQYFNPYLLALPPTNTTGCVLLINPTSENAIDTSNSQHTGFDVNTTVSDDYPSPYCYTVRQWLYGYDSGDSNGDVYVKIYDYDLVTQIPVGATTVRNGTTETVVYSSYSTSPYFQGTPGQLLQLTPTDNSITAGDTVTFSWSGAPVYTISNSGGADEGSPVPNRFEATFPDGAQFFWRIEPGYQVNSGFDTATSGVLTLSGNRAEFDVTVTNDGMPGSDSSWTAGVYSDAGYNNQVAYINATVSNQNNP